MSQEPESLIERAEREAGCQWDDPNNPGAVAILFGALSRELGQHKFGPEDDFIVGTLIMDDIQNGDKRRQDEALLLAMLQAGLSPDDIAKLSK